MNKRILITSVAGLTGLVVSKTLLKNNKLILFGTDIVDCLIGLQEKIIFHVSPPSNAPDYFDFISNYIIKNKIDIIIPVSSHDVYFFSLNKDAFNKYCKILIVNKELHNKLNIKPESYKLLNKVGIRTPRIYVNESVLQFPAIIKPIRSSGSKDSFEIKNKKDYDYYTSKFNDFFISQHIVGEEYTCDCFFNLNGKCSGYVVRKRDKVVAGAAVKSTSVDMDLSDTITKFEKIKQLIGPLNFQFKIKDGEIIIFDINDRMASGGLALSIELGLNIPMMILDELDGKGAQHGLKSKKVTMIRYYEEYFIEN